MRRWTGGSSILGAALTVISALGAAGCHEPRQTQKVVAVGVLDTSALDFGEVPVGEWRTARVKVQNVGYVPFNALEVLKLEDNPSFHVEISDGRVMPGQEREVVVRFHPLAEGELKDTIHVDTDADDKPQDLVTIRGVGTPTPVRIEPNLLDFETLEVNSDRTLEVTITNPVDIPLTVKLSGLTVQPFAADAVTIPPFGSQRVNLKYSPTLRGENYGLVEVRACESCTPATAGLKGKAVPYAFEFDPAPVPFQNVPVHESTRSKTVMKNVTWRTVKVEKTRTSDDSFKVLTDLSNQLFKPGDTMEVEMEFAARFSGPDVGQVDVNYLSDKTRTAPLPLDARGGRPTLALTPVSVDFGEVPVGSKAEKVIRMTNAGTTGPIHFLGVRGDGAESAQFSVSTAFRGDPKVPAQTYPWAAATNWPDLASQSPVAIQPGDDALDIKVFFNPEAVGDHSLTLVFKSDDLFFPEKTVTLTGRARESGPCQFIVKPATQLDFGNVPVGSGAVLGFYFENTGTQECAVKDIKLTNNGGGAFFMPGGEIAGGSVPWGSAFSAQIAFKAVASGAYNGELSITVNNPTTPVVKLPLKAVAQATCLVAAPNYLDFGPIRTDCSPIPRRTLIANQCQTPVTVDQISLGEGTSEQFQINAQPPMPQVVQPGQGFEVEVTYARNVFGQHFTPMYVHATNETASLLVPLLAETNRPGYNDDRFIQGTENELDVLFVISNTTTMQSYQDRLQSAIAGWLSRSAQKGVDLRVGVTSTGLIERSSACGGGANGGEAGRLYPADGSRARVVASTAPNAATTLQQNVEVGACHNLEQGLESMRAALSSPLIDHQDDPRTALPNDGNFGLLRPEARLAVVFLSDEDDHSGFDPQSYSQFLQALKGTGMAHRVAAYAIVPTDGSCQTAGAPGNRFNTVAWNTAGSVMNICAPDYGNFLDLVAERAAGLQDSFKLSQVPFNAAALTVKVNGQVKTKDTAWTYDSANNAIVFTTGNVPAPGQVIEVEYQAACVGG